MSSQPTVALSQMDYSEDFKFVEVPDPLADVNPKQSPVTLENAVLGEVFEDPHYLTKLTVVTPASSSRNEYSRFDPFNFDHSMIILHDVSLAQFSVYGTSVLPYTHRKNHVCDLGNLSEPRWDPNDKNVIWGVQDFRIYTLDVRGCRRTLVKDFSRDKRIGKIIRTERDLYRLTNKDEGESSLDKDIWAFFLQGTDQDYRARYIFSWSRKNDEVIGVYKTSQNEAGLDWVGVSPYGNHVLIGAADYNTGNLSGLIVSDPDLNPKSFRRLHKNTGHSDVGLDSDGNEVIVMQTSSDYVEAFPLSKGDGDAPLSTPVARLYYNWNDRENSLHESTGVHLSCNVPGYCVLSSESGPNAEDRNWLEQSNILIKLDLSKPRAFYLSKSYTVRKSYWESTLSAISNDGSKIVWGSNWYDTVGDEKFFMMQLDMPKNWRELTD